MGQNHPQDESQQADCHHHWDKDTRNAIGKLLHWSTLTLSLLHKANNLRQGRVLTHSSQPDLQDAPMVHRSTNNLIAHFFRDGQGLPGECRLIYCRFAPGDDAICRDLGARKHLDQIPLQQQFSIHLAFPSALQQQRSARSQSHQGGDGVTSAPLGATFQPLSHEHESDEQRRCVKVQTHRCHLMTQKFAHQLQAAGEVCSRGSQHHHGSHAKLSMPQTTQGLLVEDPTAAELHRRCQGEHQQTCKVHIVGHEELVQGFHG
mmetsp:Transcript_27308/g.59535  ORF Transcript_27308/g.59535 Transcript_27308/m.59535 type:complete len:261 (+) Transcript_27308:1990-2772(+)